MFSYTRWQDMFGDQVSKMREAQTGRIELLYDVEIESIEDMEGALYRCWVEGIKPKQAAQRYTALIDH